MHSWIFGNSLNRQDFGHAIMNMHDSNQSALHHPAAEPLEQLTVFLPRSVLRDLHEQVPAGQRRAFIARALQAALQHQTEKV